MKTDLDLKRDVERELAWDILIDDAAIGVAVHHGVVTLTGTVSSWAAKHAVEGLTKTAALEGAAFDVRVIAVAPGPTDTGMLRRLVADPDRWAEMIATVPLKRVGTPDEIASAIVFLASDEASFITGHVLFVDGGKSAT